MRLIFRLTFVILVIASLPLLSKAQETKSRTVQVSFPIPLSGNVVWLTARLSTADSLARLAYVRHRVRTIAKLRTQPGKSADTLERKTFDQQGNTVTTYEPTFNIRLTQEYNTQNQVIKITKTIPNDYYCLETIDLQHKQYKAWQGNDLSDKHLTRSATQSVKGDTVINQTLLNDPIVVLGQTLSRIVSRFYYTGPDTLQYDILGYNEADEVIATEHPYYVRRKGLTVEGGVVSYELAMASLFNTSSQARQWRSQGLSDGTIRQRLPHLLQPTYIPTDYQTYDEAGRLILTTNRTLAEPKVRTNYNDNASIQASNSSSHRYVYDKKGHVIREEVKASFLSVEEKPANKTTFITERTFSPKGLVVSEKLTQKTSETGTQDEQAISRYEYHYTYY